MTQKRIGGGSTPRKTNNNGKSPIGLLYITQAVVIILLVWILVKINALESGGGAAEVATMPETAEMTGDIDIDEPPADEPADIPADEEISPAELESPLKVEVLNGVGAAGLAGRTADFLRSKGFDVRDIGNAPHEMYSQSLIYLRTSRRGETERLAETLNIPSDRIVSQEDPSKVDIDASVILGHDYKDLTLQ